MPNFKDTNDFARFRRHVSRDRRYLMNDESHEFLNCVAATMNSRLQELPVGTVVARAQIGNTERPIHFAGLTSIQAAPFEESRMRPLKDSARAGRANPQGIPVLYCALDKQTAVAETRPWVSALVSVAHFETTRPMKIVNCVDNFRGKFFKIRQILAKEPQSFEEHAWHDIDTAFSMPVSRDELLPDYVPTQILAELFRREGADGIGFRSAVCRDGYNLAVFDVDAFSLVSSEVVEVTEVKVTLSEGPFIVS